MMQYNNPLQLKRMSILLFLAACVAIALSYAVIGYLAYRKQQDMLHPLPALFLMAFTLGPLLVGIGVAYMYGRYQTALATLSELDYSLEIVRSQTHIQGLEYLIDRWRDFKPAANESDILHSHILLLNSIIQLNYPPDSPIRIVRYFPGNKIRGGIFLLAAAANTSTVLKIDHLANIEAEIQNYRAYVKPCLNRTPGEPDLPKQRHVYIDENSWGGIRYNLLDMEDDHGSQVLSLADYCQGHSPKEIAQALAQVFESLAPWWDNRPRSKMLAQAAGQPALALSNEYNRLYRYRADIRDGIMAAAATLNITSLQAITRTQPCLQLTSELEVDNPLYWLEQSFNQSNFFSQLDQPGLRWDSIVHGDLHAHNILIGESNGRVHAWIIDFPRVHLGPTVQDLARLEASIVTGMIDEHCQELSLENWLVFITTLLPSSSATSLAQLTPRELSEQIPIRDQLEAIRQVVLVLRSEAVHFTMGNDPRPYYLALLYAALPMMKYRDLLPVQKLGLFLLAAVLCGRF